MVEWLRSLAFSIGFLVTLVIIAAVGMLTVFLPYRQRYAFLTLWGRMNIAWLRWTCGVGFRVEGRENIPDGPAIVLSRHESTWETLAFQQIFPAQVYVLKRELLWLPLFGWALALLKPIAIDRGAGRRAVQQVIGQGLDRLAQGLWIVVFPEGTRLAPGERRRFGVGGALLAERSGCPVVPVAHNAGDFWPRRRFVKRSGEIRVLIGEPIESKGKSAVEINAITQRWIEQAIETIRKP